MINIPYDRRVYGLSDQILSELKYFRMDQFFCQLIRQTSVTFPNTPIDTARDPP